MALLLKRDLRLNGKEMFVPLTSDIDDAQFKSSVLKLCLGYSDGLRL